MLGDDSCIDWKRLSEFIQKCVSYDGGIGQMPTDESHGEESKRRNKRRMSMIISC